MSTKERSKSGTGIHGKYYERGIITWIALKCLSDKTVKDYWIHSNPSGIEKFDDIIFYVEYKTGEDEVLFFQLKHKEESGVPFRTCSLQSDKKFKLSTYEIDYIKITEKGNPILEKLNIKETTKKSFCLYTNFVTTEEEEKTKSVFNLQLVKDGDINDLADTSVGTESSIYKVVDPKKLCNENFLGEFYLWLNQIDECNINARISKDFRINETAVVRLRSLFERRFEPLKKKERNTGTVEKFTRKEMLQKIFEIIVDHYRIPSQMHYGTNESLIVLNIIQSYKLTIIKQTYSEQKIWNDILRQIGSELESSHRIGITDKDEKKLKDIYLNLVCEFQIPFLIRTSSPFFEYFQNYLLDAVPMSTVIFLDDKNVVINKDGRICLEFITDLTDHLIEFCSPYSPKISFQGKEGIDLLEFVKVSNKPNQRLDIDVLFKYINQTITIGQENVSPDNYINRKINVPVMKLEEKPSNEAKRFFCIQIFCNCPKKKGSSLGLVNLMDYIESPKQNRKIAASNFFSVTPFSMNLVKKLNALRKGRKKHIHIFEKMNNDDFFIPIYREGYGDCDVMKKLASEQIDDVNIIGFYEKNQMNVLCDNAGEGKTMLLKHISSHLPPDVWVVTINLRNASNLTVTRDFNVFIKEIYNLEEKQTREIDHDILMKIYKICIDKKKVIWLVDDYEEIGTPQLTYILKKVRLAGMKTFITSRPFRRTDLEMEFGISAMEMIPITLEEQSDFFENYLAGSKGDENTSKSLETIRAIREKMNKTFIGVFQQMTMLAEILKLPGQISNSEYEIHDLYEKFIELKMKSHKKHHQDIMKIMMQKFALVHFFSDLALDKFFDMKELQAQMKFFKEEYQKGPIITHITDDNRVIFSHETYAEYLAAQWLAKKMQDFLIEKTGNKDNLENMKQIIELLYIQKLRTVRYFFDAILTRTLPMLSAIVNRQYDLMKPLYLEEENIIDQTDILGRNLLHFLIGNQSQYEIQTNVRFLRQPQEQNVSFRTTGDFVHLSVPKGTESSSEELQFLAWFDVYHSYTLQRPSNLFHLKKDNYLDFNLGQFILLSGSLALLEKLISNKLMRLPNVERKKRYLLFTHGIMNKFNNIIAQVDIRDLNITNTHILNHSSMSLLHLSILFSNWEAFQILLRIENNLERWNNDSNDNTVLHTACENSDTKFIKALCYEGRFSTEYLNKINHKGLSSFHCLCTIDSDQCVEEVINRPGLDFEMSCNEGNTPFISSISSGNLRISEILYSKGANVDQQNKNGFSAMHYACMKNLYDCVQKLIDWNANIDIQNKYGLTPLCFAVKNNNMEIVRLLIKRNANVNIADRRGWTVLHHAVKHNNIELLGYLIDSGAEVGYKNKKRWTPLMLAFFMQNPQAMRVIVPYVSSETIINTNWHSSRRRFR